MFKKTVFTIVLVLGLLLVASVAVASASGPYIMTGSGGNTYLYDTMCTDFVVEHTVSFTYMDKYFFDEYGDLVRIKSHVNGNDVLVNTVSGKTLTGKFAETATYIFDGDTTLYHSSGQDWNITYPGMGQIFKQEGTAFAEFPANGPPVITHMSASHADGFYGNTAELCAALGQ